MSLSALPAFTDDCYSTIDARASRRIVDLRAPRRLELAAILVTRRGAARRGRGWRAGSVVREERRTAALTSHTRRHIAYDGPVRAREPIVVRRATLLALQRGEGTDVLAAPRTWKNDFR